MWNLRWGKHLAFLEEQARKYPDDPPASLADRPWVGGQIGEMLDAFFVLSPSRQQGMGPGGILLSEMQVYCQIHEIDDVPRFIRFMQALDAAYLEHVGEELKKQK